MIQTYLCLGVMCLATFNLSAWSKSGQESIVLIFLDFLFSQSTASILSRFGLLGSNLTRSYVSICSNAGIELPSRFHILVLQCDVAHAPQRCVHP